MALTRRNFVRAAGLAGAAGSVALLGVCAGERQTRARTNLRLPAVPVIPTGAGVITMTLPTARKPGW